MLKLKTLPEPKVIDELTFEGIRQEIEDLFLQEFSEDATVADQAKEPTRDHMRATLKAEGNLVAKLIQAMAHHSLLLQGRANDKVKSMLLQYATGSDLQSIGALFGVEWPIISVGDPNANPPVPDVYEDEESYRERVASSLFARTVAGPPDAWRYHARLPRPDVVEDASVIRVGGGNVEVYLLPRVGAVISHATLAEIAKHLKDVVPWTSTPYIQVASSVPFSVEANITVLPNVVGSEALLRARKSLDALLARSRALGRDVTISSLTAALHVDGVYAVSVVEPSESILISPDQYPELQTEPLLSESGTNE